MAEKTFTVIDASGIHARPASVLVHEASQFNSDIILEFKEKSVNLKSIMAVMALGIPKGSKITIVTTGTDETEALDALTQTMKNHGFGE